MLFNKNIELIPIRDINITKDETYNYGCDFTVKDNYTFCTHDGVYVQDSMGILVPLSEESQKECKEKMVTATSNFGIDSQNYKIANEMVIGLYAITTMDNGGIYQTENIDVKKLNEDSLTRLKVVNPGKRVRVYFKGKQIETTIGKVIFNAILPPYIEYINEPANSKIINKYLVEILSVNKNDYGQTIQNLMKYGFYFSTIYPKTISLRMLQPSKEIEKLKEKLGKEQNLEKQLEIINQIKLELGNNLKENYPDLYDLVYSGASKGMSQVNQIAGAKGVTSGINGEALKPVTHSFSDGMSVEEYFHLGVPSRNGVIAKALGTATGGYEYRKSIYLCGDIKANINVVDCGTLNTLNIKLTKELFKRLSGRYVLSGNNKPVPINETMIGNMIKLRSPVFCQNWKICRTCYGDLLFQLNSENIGIIAAQSVLSLSERFMKCSCGTFVHENQIWAFEDLFDE